MHALVARRLGVAGILVVSVFFAVSAQQSVPRAGPAQGSAGGNPTSAGLILGRVVDATTNRPVSGAVATLTGLTQTTGPTGGTTLTSMTSGDGYFLFRGLAKGSYPINVTAPGYLSGSNGRVQPEGPSRSVVVDQDQRVLDVTIRMWRYASITGRVIDESGEPAVGIGVAAVPRGGSGRPLAATTIQTDDRGIYRIASLAPGDYFVVIPQVTNVIPTSAREMFRDDARSADLRRTLPPGMYPLTTPKGGGVRVGDLEMLPGRVAAQPQPGGAMLGYQTTYYSGATSIASATAVTVGSGEQRAGVDLQLKLSPMLRVSGYILRPDGSPEI